MGKTWFPGKELVQYRFQVKLIFLKGTRQWAMSWLVGYDLPTVSSAPKSVSSLLALGLTTEFRGYVTIHGEANPSWRTCHPDTRRLDSRTCILQDSCGVSAALTGPDPNTPGTV